MNELSNRLIYAEELCLSLGKYFNHIRKIDKRRVKQIDAIEQDVYAEITNAPTVDALIVTRCKDCKYMMGDPNYDTGHKCSIHQEDGKPHEVWLDDFCSWAEVIDEVTE